MAVNKKFVNSSVKVMFDGGLVDGVQKYQSRVFAGVKEDATDENVLAAAKAIATLTEKRGLKYVKSVSTELTEE